MADFDTVHVIGSFRAVDLPIPGEALLKLESSTGRVTIGGGGSIALLTVGGRTPAQTQMSIDASTFRFKARLSTATSQPIETQAVLLLTATDWAAGKSRDLNGVIATRADGTGSAFWIIESPGNEMVHIYPSGRIAVYQWNDGPAFEVRDNTPQHTLQAAFGPEALFLGASSLPAASATYRGQMRRVEGAVRCADALFICEKKADESYWWRAI
jgi:hypothetical protein